MATAVSETAQASAGALRTALKETSDSIREVFGSRALRRIQLALVGSSVGDWAYATAVTVWAYGVGGAKAVGLWAAVRFVIMAISAPFAAAIADKWPRKLVMIGADVARFVLIAAAAACIAADTAAAPVFILATVTSILGCVFRPAQAAWLPALAERPEQLTAANGVSSTIESLSFFVGPALGATLIAATNVQTVFLINAVTFLWSASLVASIAAPQESANDEGEDEPTESALAMMFAGFREIGGNRDLGVIVVLVCVQTIVAGASTVFAVLWAVEYLDVGPRGIGYLDAVLGVGAVVGGLFALSRASRGRLTWDLDVGVLLWSLPLLVVVAWPSAATAFIASAMLGFGNPLVDVNFYTAVQRIAPERVLGRVFGAIEGALIAGMALGAAVMPFLVDGTSLRTALAILAVIVAVPAFALLPVTRNIDRRLSPPAGVELLHPLPIFAPLGPARLEALARQLVRTAVPAGSVVVREGESGDLFYIIESGRVRVTHGTEAIREEGPGEYFGEIALLRDVPRTATVTTIEDSVLLTLARGPFLDAVTGNVESSQALDDVISYRMRF
ncbi:MAG TPA: MFS transporter [Jatrophihabitantaceae bacterium]|nr:MFS transporter [Jatrophihabitantaceae bacterium]